ncbi:MAG: aldehyde dehydrogenase family protein [Actinomycetota bacterium]
MLNPLPAPRHPDQHFIGGEWVTSHGAGRIEVINPATEEVFAAVPAGAETDVDDAVVAARRAFPGWAEISPDERGGYLARIAGELKQRQEEIAQLITAEMGSPITYSRKVQAGLLPITVMSSYAQLLDGYSFEEQIGNSLVILEPVGVVGGITPWNFPLHQAVLKIAAALAAGCTIVVKPSELAPFSVNALCEVAAGIGLPAGVLNMVHGAGPTVGEALVAHPGVNAVSFTGSTRIGARVAALAGERIKKVTLELGGKSANVILSDVDGDLLVTAVEFGVRKCFMNSGQSCNALTRLLVPADRHDQAVRVAVEATASQSVGDPLDEGTRIGPMVSEAQRDRVRGYIEKGIAEGARLAAGGPEPPAGLRRGYFVQPTIFAEATPDMTIAQEEIFGPVLTLIPYTDEAQALEIANGTAYGLAGAVWSADVDRARAFARRMRAGQVDLNGGRWNVLAPFGGVGASGFGREYGRYGLEEFSEVKSLQYE